VRPGGGTRPRGGSTAYCLFTYTRERFAFDRPVGSNQAVKHKLADVLAAIEIARSNAYYAAWMMAQDGRDATLAAAAARLSAAATDWQRAKADAGFAAILWPKECGGRAGTPMEQIIFSQEESAYHIPTGAFIRIGVNLAGPTIMRRSRARAPGGNPGRQGRAFRQDPDRF
jgi:alkylation response protein AidB-like acyl-CoA dehydrogenase